MTFDEKQYQKEYRLKNKERYRPYHKEYQRKYREKPDVIEKEKIYRQKPHTKEINKKAQEKHKPKHRTYNQGYRLKHRLTCIKHYSQDKNCCAICGINDIDVLTMDHINGGGNQHRIKLKSAYLPTVLFLNNFPEGYRILCMNCNMKESKRKKLYVSKQFLL
jgi:hypothetical protein